jgi:hypothetical protein
MYIDSDFGVDVPTGDVNVMNLLQKYVEPITYAAQASVMLYGHNHRLERISAAYQNKTVLASTPRVSGVASDPRDVQPLLSDLRTWCACLLSRQSMGTSSMYFTSQLRPSTTLLGLLALHFLRTTAGPLCYSRQHHAPPRSQSLYSSPMQRVWPEVP